MLFKGRFVDAPCLASFSWSQLWSQIFWRRARASRCVWSFFIKGCPSRGRLPAVWCVRLGRAAGRVAGASPTGPRRVASRRLGITEGDAHEPHPRPRARTTYVDYDLCVGRTPWFKWHSPYWKTPPVVTGGINYQSDLGSGLAFYTRCFLGCSMRGGLQTDGRTHPPLRKSDLRADTTNLLMRDV